MKRWLILTAALLILATLIAIALGEGYTLRISWGASQIAVHIWVVVLAQVALFAVVRMVARVLGLRQWAKSKLSARKNMKAETAFKTALHSLLQRDFEEAARRLQKSHFLGLEGQLLAAQSALFAGDVAQMMRIMRGLAEHYPKERKLIMRIQVKALMEAHYERNAFELLSAVLEESDDPTLWHAMATCIARAHYAHEWPYWLKKAVRVLSGTEYARFREAALAHQLAAADTHDAFAKQWRALTNKEKALRRVAKVRILQGARFRLNEDWMKPALHTLRQETGRDLDADFLLALVNANEMNNLHDLLRFLKTQPKAPTLALPLAIIAARLELWGMAEGFAAEVTETDAAEYDTSRYPAYILQGYIQARKLPEAEMRTALEPWRPLMQRAGFHWA